MDDVKIAPYKISKRQRKKANKAEREKTAGSNWFNMPATEVTDEIKRDLSVLKMRDALDRKQFYKRNSGMKEIPKYFQVGTVVGTSADYYESLPKKQRKNTFVNELLEDAELRRWNKKKYGEILKSNPHYLREQRRANRKRNKLTKAEAKETRKQQWADRNANISEGPVYEAESNSRY
ncbi:Deoxynucleotidyltransferase terminal-interacting protein 2 [Halotydeus destructor]|nr:Deoxynucleotidyltransferase terminal-interacting protein 2 [Halotydeus destructor]